MDPPRETVCPRCGVGCHLARRSGEPRVEGRPGPANPDGRLCRRGIGAVDAVDGDRFEHPAIARDGRPVPVDWETALDHVAGAFDSVLDAHGPDALAFLGAPHGTNEANYLLGKLARMLGTNDVDNRARGCHVSMARTLSRRLGWPATTNGLEDLREADVVLVVGANPAERQPVAFNAFVRPAVADGATLVHVDPVANRTTRLADVHLAPRPGTDATLLDLLCAHLVDEDGLDREFVARRTRGSEAFLAGLRTLDRSAAASVAGVGDDAVERAVDVLAGADRIAALAGTGIEGAGEAAPDALVNLLLLTGSVGRPGTGLYLLRGLVNEQGATDAGCVPDRLPGHQPVTDPAARARVEAEWGVEVPAEPGRTASELLGEFGDGIRAALVVGENPAVSKRPSDRVARRLDALDVLVVVEVAPSETTPHADVVLPAAAGIETAGTVTSLDRRIQRLRPTASPPGEARPDADILAALGRRLVEVDGAFDYDGPETVFDELTRVAPTHAGLSYGALGRSGRRWPVDADVLYRDRFGTGEGRAAFVGQRRVASPVANGQRTAEGLRLVTGGRASEDRTARPDRALRLHPSDADERGIDQGDAVVVTSGDAVVEVSASPEAAVRPGTVYLHAAVADPLVRRGASTVTVEPSPGGTGSSRF